MNNPSELATLETQKLAVTDVVPVGYEPLPWKRGSRQLVPDRKGRFRGMTPALKAETDAQAVNAWLASKSRESVNTRDKYRREAERLLLWAASRDQVLSDLAAEDFETYGEFLMNPKPHSIWVANRRYPRDDPEWRPFIGPLSRQSRFQSLSVVYSMLMYLNRKGWLSVVALDAPTAPKSIGERNDDLHALSPNQVNAILAAVKEIPKAIERLQTRFLVELLLFAGPRTSDLITGNMRDIQPEVIEGKIFTIWRVVGKGNKPRAIPLKRSTVEALQDYREALGLSKIPDNNEPPYPIAMRIRGLRAFEPHTFKSVTRQGLYLRFQRLYEKAAENLVESGFESEATAIGSATTHTYRHTALKSLADASKGDMRKVMKLAGHSSLSTSGRYTKSTLAELAEFMDGIVDG